MSEWIEVNERLPQDRLMAVLVFNGDAPIYNQCVAQATWFGQTQSFKRETDGPYLGTITHWMPMPEPPEISNPLT